MVQLKSPQERGGEIHVLGHRPRITRLGLEEQINGNKMTAGGRGDSGTDQLDSWTGPLQELPIYSTSCII